MAELSEFMQRVLKRVKAEGVKDFALDHWSVAGKATKEAVGLLPVAGADPEKVMARVMDVGRYVGNVEHVAECRVIPDAAYDPPKSVRFYQKLKIPLLGEIQHELVMERLGNIAGFEIAAWRMMEKETLALSPKNGIRSAYSDGAWLVAPGLVGYALSSAPMRDDVGFLKFKALTAGADVAAAKVLRENIEGMARWASRA